MGLAAIDNDIEIMEMLLKTGCDPNFNGTAALFFDVMDYFDYDNYEYIYDEDYYNYAEYEEDYYYWDDEDDGRYIGGVTVLHIASVEGSKGYFYDKLNHSKLFITILSRCSESTDQARRSGCKCPG